jgi:hypothetical protein
LTVVSSTLVRQEVTAGNVERAAELLGSPLTHPAQITRNNTLAFDVGLAVPECGTFAATANGQQVALRMCGSKAEIIGLFPPITGLVTISFQHRVDPGDHVSARAEGRLGGQSSVRATGDRRAELLMRT